MKNSTDKPRLRDWYAGADCSTLEAVEACGGRFTDGGAPDDCLRILRRHGANLLRLRLWNDPYSQRGEPYGGGTSDFDRTARLAARGAALGMDWMLDLHYSDFWADPGKQVLPKAWADLSGPALEDAVFRYTAETLEKLAGRRLSPQLVSVGNEITNGLLWPHGQKPAWETLARLVSAGIRAVREAAPEAAVLLHLDNGGNNAQYREWFDRYLENGGADFDCIGLSYYPYWHGTPEDLRANLADLAARYGKPMLLAETSTAFTLEPDRGGNGRLIVTPELAARVPFPATPAGQAAFLRALAALVAGVPGGLGRGFVWWEPGWLPVPGCGWTTPAGLAYIGQTGSCANEWANQALFDYDGAALPAVASFPARRPAPSSGA